MLTVFHSLIHTCDIRYGVAQEDLFGVDDLFEDNDMLRVMRSLGKLKSVADSKL